MPMTPAEQTRHDLLILAFKRDRQNPAIRSEIALAKHVMRQLDDYAENGLPECYSGEVETMLFDLYPDLPWDPKASIVSVQWLLTAANSRAVLHRFQERFRYDMVAEFKRALVYWRDCDNA